MNTGAKEYKASTTILNSIIEESERERYGNGLQRQRQRQQIPSCYIASHFYVGTPHATLSPPLLAQLWYSYTFTVYGVASEPRPALCQIVSNIEKQYITNTNNHSLQKPQTPSDQVSKGMKGAATLQDKIRS